MALVVETGAIVTGADSYVARADYITYASTLGVTITDDETTDVKLRKAAEFIDSHEPNLKGSKVDKEQPRSFPRIGFSAEGFYWNSNEIPRQVTLAQMAIALDLEAGIDIYNPPTNPNLAKKSVEVDGAVKVEYAIDNNSPMKVNRSSTATAIMNTLLKNSGLSMVLTRA